MKILLVIVYIIASVIDITFSDKYPVMLGIVFVLNILYVYVKPYIRN